MKVLKKQNNSRDCLICGVDNPFGVKAQFYEVEDDSVVTIVKFRSEHQSYPGRTHGGMITALLDELVGRAIWITEPQTWGVTMTLSMKFRKPVPYDEKLRAVGRIVSKTSRTFSGEGKIFDMDGKLLAECTATYMKLPIDKIADAENSNAADIYIEDDVEDI
ncbi:MAG: PaaI family thioesterase [Clostridiales bacterium]|nr:PaaI family thioesterase [Clostridiales bacterium]